MTLQISFDALNRVVRARGGFIDRRMGELADAVLKTARENIREKATFRGHHRDRGGGIAASGKVLRIGNIDRMIVFDHPYALGLHEGARPHFMEEMEPGFGLYLRTRPQPVSYSLDRVFATTGPIRHPGHAPFFYLTRAAQAHGLRSQSPGVVGAGFRR